MAPASRGPIAENLEADSSAVMERLGVAEALSDSVDPLSLLRSLVEALGSQARHPVAFSGLLRRHASRLGQGTAATLLRAVGLELAGPAEVGPKDRRFAEPAWSENAAFYGLLQLYLLNRQLLSDIVEASGLEGAALAKARFAANLISDAVSPTNFVTTNPAVLRRTAETGGWSLLRGIRNAVDDVIHNGGWPKQVDTSPFELGRNMAATAGQVVFRNDLIELIQYQPTTEKTHEIPLLIGPPWINKYYIVDLAPGKSLVEWTRQPRDHHLLYQLPQPGCLDARLRIRRLSAQRSPERRSTSSARSPARRRSTPCQSAWAARSTRPCSPISTLRASTAWSTARRR